MRHRARFMYTNKGTHTAAQPLLSTTLALQLLEAALPRMVHPGEVARTKLIGIRRFVGRAVHKHHREQSNDIVNQIKMFLKKFEKLCRKRSVTVDDMSKMVLKAHDDTARPL